MGVFLTPNGPEIEEMKCLLIGNNGMEVGLLILKLDELDIQAESGRVAPTIRITGSLQKGIQLDS